MFECACVKTPSLECSTKARGKKTVDTKRRVQNVVDTKYRQGKRTYEIQFVNVQVHKKVFKIQILKGWNIFECLYIH